MDIKDDFLKEKRTKCKKTGCCEGRIRTLNVQERDNTK
jgi:hypothetical protein